MDVIILAGGRGSRLAGVAEPYYKPLLEVNGRSLIRHAWGYAQAAEAERTIVVAAPTNVAALADEVPEALFAMQEWPTGPADAVLLGLALVNSARVMVLTSDNIMDADDVHMMSKDDGDAVGVNWVTPDEATRFTRIDTHGRFIEGAAPVSDVEITPSGQVMVWCGPIVARSWRLARAIERQPRSTSEHKLGPLLNDVLETPNYYRCSAIDIGEPAAFRRATT